MTFDFTDEELSYLRSIISVQLVNAQQIATHCPGENREHFRKTIDARRRARIVLRSIDRKLQHPLQIEGGGAG
jgi:hypothetical protein